MTLPGERLKRLAARCCSPQTMERLVEPIVADLQTEYRDSTAARAGWRRRLRLWSGYAGFWKALALHAVLACVGPGPEAARTPLSRTLAYSCLTFACFTVLLVLPSLLNGVPWSRGAASQVILALCLVPQALPLSLPAGLCVGVLGAMRGRPATVQHAMSVLAIGLVATCLAWVLMERGVPYANQRFRELVIAQLVNDGRQREAATVHLEPGLNEIGLSNLALRQDPLAVRHYHVLSALCLATIPLSVFALGLAPRFRRLGPAMLAGVLVPLGYFAVVWTLAAIGPTGLTAAVLSAWMPNVLFMTGGCALLHRAWRTA